MVHSTKSPDATKFDDEDVRFALRQDGWTDEVIDMFIERKDRSDIAAILSRRMGPPRRRKEEQHRKPLPQVVKAEVWAKTDGCCWYCGKQTNPFRDFTVDHVHPVSLGGSDDVDNLVPACRSCNCSKGARA